MGSVTSIKSDELMKTNPISINQSLQGRIAGVQVNQNDRCSRSRCKYSDPWCKLILYIYGTAFILWMVFPFTNQVLGDRQGDGMLQTTNPLLRVIPAILRSIEI